MGRRILFIVNPSAASGRGTERFELWRDRFARQNVKPDHAISRRPGHAFALAREAAAKYDVIVAAGGDGTVNEVASGLLLAGRVRAALGVLPVGTGNDVARVLGIPDPEIARRALERGPIQAIDAIAVSHGGEGSAIERFALLYAAVGFAGELGRCTTPTVKRLFGPRYCYSIGFFRALFRFKTPHMTVRCDGRDFAGRMFLVSAGNAEVVGGGAMRLSPGARIDDGQLKVNLVGDLDLIETMRCFPRLLTGTHVTHPQVRYFSAKTMAVESRPEMDVQLDGELVGRTPVTFQVRPGALRVCTGWGLTDGA